MIVHCSYTARLGDAKSLTLTVRQVERRRRSRSVDLWSGPILVLATITTADSKFVYGYRRTEPVREFVTY